MDSVRVDSGLKRIAINNDPERLIEFDPTDVLFAERFYQIYGEFEAKQKEYEERARHLDAGSGEDISSANLGQGIAFMREVCEFMRDKIDVLFGPGTSRKVFGDTLSLSMIGQFLEGMTPYFQQARTEKTQKYVNTASKRRVMK